MTYHHQVLLVMELDRSHVGKLVQLITDSWSMTGTLTRVDQHDNREWEISYPSRTLVPVRGEIYATLHIGPWVGDVIGNQPVTVETVKGTLEAPETATRAVTNLITPEEAAEARATILKGIQPGEVADLFEVPVDLVDPGVVKGTVVDITDKSGWRDDLPPVHATPEEVEEGREFREVLDAKLARIMKNLPPEPVPEWVKSTDAHRHDWVLDPHRGWSCECGQERPLDWRGDVH